MAKIPATPGVYINENSAFPNSAVPVATAIPAFVGYTEKAVRDKTDLKNCPTRIASFGEYARYFGEGPKTRYTIKDVPNTHPNRLYALETVRETRFLLFQSIKLFFANGGSDCYIVSAGSYQDTVNLAGLGAGITALLRESEPTILLIPDAMLLPEQHCGELQQKMLGHCEKMSNRFAILDVFMDENAGTAPDTQAMVKNFRSNIGNNALQWGAAYYPWLHTNISGAETVDFTSIDPGPAAVAPAGTLNISLPDTGPYGALKDLLKKEVKNSFDEKELPTERAQAIVSEINKIKPGLSDAEAKSLHQTLVAISPLYKAIMTSVLEKVNLLPPSGGMAGIYSMVDNQVGVFQSPANVSIGSVVQPCVYLTNEEQEDLNVPLDGKAVNAIRTFPGKGVLVWGARTLDGNSQDWRYVSVRRTVIFIEQSIKYAAEPYAFAPNTPLTWTNVNAMITNFLTNMWQSGALAGSTPADAFSVDVGLGTTMTPVDILDGIMRITVKIAVTRPAEFIVLTFEQKMQAT